MTQLRFSQLFFATTATLLLCTSCSSNYTNQVIAQVPSSPSIDYNPPPPPGTGPEPTDRRQGGAGRGCEPTALAPTIESNQGKYLWGLTVASHPRFWFSLPRKITTKDAIAFVLEDEAGKEVYKTMVQKSQIPQGIVSFSLPTKVPALQVGKSYRWSFSVYCDYQTVEDKPGTVTGKIQRVAVSSKIQNQLKNAKTPLMQAKIYAQNGIWFDAVTTLGLAKMQGKKDKAITSGWSELLTQVNLSKVTSLPVTSCCKKS
ncbi:DUF928 domain-containing protein [Calothrix sp. 336/3]|uniref:DUF928 domain-containing protein n=1 Tax=Calothrix sp. 336/3 TaxID=1337936 RepID=UPI0004E363D9|nr:DUF928 domain-containing protein [Calothrix sp. 336/3]AKG20881.1 hypothetical protein IJ00_05810 [Calothrix sp. 336/3]